MRVFICSPLTAPTKEGIELHRQYAIKCCWDSMNRGESPYCPHLFLTISGLLDEMIPDNRRIGMAIGDKWGLMADLIAVYVDYGISDGMKAEIDRYRHKSIPYEQRSLDAVEQAKLRRGNWSR